MKKIFVFSKNHKSMCGNVQEAKEFINSIPGIECNAFAERLLEKLFAGESDYYGAPITGLCTTGCGTRSFRIFDALADSQEEHEKLYMENCEKEKIIRIATGNERNRLRREELYEVRLGLYYFELTFIYDKMIRGNYCTTSTTISDKVIADSGADLFAKACANAEQYPGAKMPDMISKKFIFEFLEENTDETTIIPSMIDYTTKRNAINFIEREGVLYINDKPSIRVSQLLWLSKQPAEQYDLAVLNVLIPMIDKGTAVEPIDLDAESTLRTVLLLDDATGHYKTWSYYNIGSLSWARYSDSEQRLLLPSRPKDIDRIRITELNASRAINPQIRAYLICDGRREQAVLVPMDGVKHQEISYHAKGRAIYVESDGVLYVNRQPLMRMGQLLWLSQQPKIYVGSLDRIVRLIDISYQPEAIDLLENTTAEECILAIPNATERSPYLLFQYQMGPIWFTVKSSGKIFLMNKVYYGSKTTRFIKLDIDLDLREQLTQHITEEQADSIISTYS